MGVEPSFVALDAAKVTQIVAANTLANISPPTNQVQEEKETESMAKRNQINFMLLVLT